MPRSNQQRQTTTERELRNDILWQEGMNLPYIEPREGFVQRWVRTRLGGEDDDSNIYKRQNQGWHPRPYTTIPKGTMPPKVTFNDADVIGMKSMILMERTVEQDDRYKQLRADDIQLQQQAIDNDVMRFHDAESGLSSRQSSINTQVHAGGRTPNVADD